jgi:heme exporter protein D
MSWGSWGAFWAMGGYAWFVWGSYGVTIALIALEIGWVVARHRAARAAIQTGGGGR